MYIYTYIYTYIHMHIHRYLLIPRSGACWSQISQANGTATSASVSAPACQAGRTLMAVTLEKHHSGTT